VPDEKMEKYESRFKLILDVDGCSSAPIGQQI
jgi:hypothetical protein